MIFGGGFCGNMEEHGGIEESSVRLVGSSVGGRGGTGSESRWVDGSEVDSESPPWSLLDENEAREEYGSLRRRLVKKPRRVDSFDVDAMEIAGDHDHHAKVSNTCCCFKFCTILLTILEKPVYPFLLNNCAH